MCVCVCVRARERVRERTCRQFLKPASVFLFCIHTKYPFACLVTEILSRFSVRKVQGNYCCLMFVVTAWRNGLQLQRRSRSDQIPVTRNTEMQVVCAHARMCVNAVSYTHLDVYKRQYIYIHVRSFCV